MAMPGTARSDPHVRRFPDTTALTEALAADIVAALEQGLRERQGASLVVAVTGSSDFLSERP